jgi:hypothetical protein
MKESYNLEDLSDGVRIISNLILNCMLECVLSCGLKLEPWRAVVNTVMNIRAPQHGEFLTS